MKRSSILSVSVNANFEEEDEALGDEDTQEYLDLPEYREALIGNLQRRSTVQRALK